MRYVLIGLGAITIALAVALAWEGLWWAAIPDGGFGLGVGWVAYVSLRDESRHAAIAAPPQPEPAPLPLPPPVPVPQPPVPPPVHPRPTPPRARAPARARRHR